MSQLDSSFLPSLGNILPSQLDTTPSGCPYIVNRGKPTEYICGKASKSGLLCAAHKLRKVFDSGNDDEDDTNSTRESTPMTDTPTRPSTGRSKRNSTLATDTPTSTARSSTPRRSTRNSTLKATPKSTSTRKSRSSLSGADSTPPTSNENGSDGIEELTNRLEELIVEDEDDIKAMPPVSEWQAIPKRVNTAESIFSFGSSDSDMKGLTKYLMEGLILHNPTVATDVIKKLSEYPNPESDGPGYVYIFLIIPVSSIRSSGETPGEIKRRFMTALKQEKRDPASQEKFIVKVGHCGNVERRLKSLRAKCKHNLYDPIEIFPSKKTELSYKAEQLVHTQLQKLVHPSQPKCLCETGHKEFYRVTPKESKAAYRCLNHWVNVVNSDHDKLWPGAVEESRRRLTMKTSELTASSRS